MALDPTSSSSGHSPGLVELPPPLRSEAPVLANVQLAGANRRLTVRMDEWRGFAPGQFAMLSPGALSQAQRSDPLLPRPMAIYRAAQDSDGARVEVLYKVAGRGTALLAEALPGQLIRFVGPLGRGFPAPEPGERALLVAGGTGIASVYELARLLGAERRPVRVLLGARSADDLMGVADFEALGGAGVELRVATEDGTTGSQGLVTALLEQSFREEGAARVYACGPTQMMRRCAEIAAAAGAGCVVSLENHMACGFGVCLGCAAPLAAGGFALVCRDGPMFDARAVAWERMP
jgi:dihydroorotate dehydrogenase electron transfer subunit